MSRENFNSGSYIYSYPYPLAKLSTFPIPQDPKFNFTNQKNNFALTSLQTFFPSINDDGNPSCCSISEPTISDHQCIGAEDHASDIASDRSPDSPTTPTTPFGASISYPPWSSTSSSTITPYNSFKPKLYSLNSHTQINYPLLCKLETKNDLQQKHRQEESSPLQSSPSLSTSSCLDYLEKNVNFADNLTKGKEVRKMEEVEDDDVSELEEEEEEEEEEEVLVARGEKVPCIDKFVKRNYQRKKSKEDIFLKFKLPVNGIATRTRSKKTTKPNQDPPSSRKKHHLTEEEKILQKYSYKAAEIPQFSHLSKKVTIPFPRKIQEIKKSNPDYPIPKTRQQVRSGWTYREQKKFLASYLSEGKNFTQLAKVLNKSTKEIVEFYYYFKMSPKFRTAKSIRKEINSYSSKLEQVNETLIKLKHLSTTGKSLSPSPVRVTFAQSAMFRKRRGRPRKFSQSQQITSDDIQYY